MKINGLINCHIDNNKKMFNLHNEIFITINKHNFPKKIIHDHNARRAKEF